MGIGGKNQLNRHEADSMVEICVDRKQQLMDLIKQGHKLDMHVPWRDICCVLTIEFCGGPFKSLLVDRHGHIYLHHKSTRVLIRQLCQLLGQSYEEFQKKMASHHYKLPYVYKHYVLLPEGGVVKKSCNWYFIHQVMQVSRDDLQRTVLRFGRHRLITNITNSQFHKQMSWIKHVYGQQLEEYFKWEITPEIASRWVFHEIMAKDSLQWVSSSKKLGSKFKSYTNFN